MNRDNLIRLIVGAVLVAFIAWLVSATEWTEVEVDTPPKGEAATNPYYSAQALLRALGAEVVKRESFDTLPPARATLVLTSNHWDLLPQRAAKLRAWVEQGGHLVIPGTMLNHDTVDAWLPVSEGDKPVKVKSDAQSKPTTRRQPGLPSKLQLLEHCRTVHESGASNASDAPSRPLQLCISMSYPLQSRQTPIWQVSGPDGAELLRVAVGAGAVTVLPPRNLLDQSFALRGDNPLLLAAALRLRGGDVVWFITEEARTPLLKWLWQHGWVALSLLLLTLAVALWRGAIRFGPLQATPTLARRSMAEQVVGTAQFLRRHGASAVQQAQVRALDEAARGHLSGYATLDVATRAARLAQATGLDPNALLAALQGTAARHDKDLIATLALLETARRRLPGGAARKATRHTPQPTEL